uniref:LAGLIDADG homing endonuclease n=1 Tax=Rhizoctonia solani TaxID=456999 RepID=A0A8E8GR42_9AGAM|nr:LAGLIDADG homing endonuclease [Rhizoctonia solani]
MYIQSIGSGLTSFGDLFICALIPVKPTNNKTSGPLTKEKRESFLLSKELKDILIGLLLGDLNILKGEKSTNAGLRFEQSIIHEDYIRHLYTLFKFYCLKEPNIYTRSPNSKTGVSYSSVRFITSSLPCFNELHELFYPLGKKIVPQNIGDLLTPLGLAFWIADDGSFKKRESAVILCTDGFTHEEVRLLSSVLIDKFNLKCTINKEKNGLRIRISSKSLPVLQTLLKDKMPPMMLHKIGL